MSNSAALAPAIDELCERFVSARGDSITYGESLTVEDYALQAAVFASPPKWHLAHTSWFFETFLLRPYLAGYETFDPHFDVLFNSYYNAVGDQFPRAQRGLLSRPSLDAVLAYRAHVDSAMLSLLQDTVHAQSATIRSRCALGIEHERQHQELFFTDILYSLSINPMHPVFSAAPAAAPAEAPGDPVWLDFAGGLEHIGHGGDGFAFDNELPQHKQWLEPFRLANRLVSNEEYQAFIDAGGYQRPEFWLADGWDLVRTEGWQAPLYWRDSDGERLEFTLHGLQPRDPAAPVCHIGGYEADAYARWAGARLPTESEWELAVMQCDIAPTGVEQGHLRPRPAPPGPGLSQVYGHCWQWTQSAYGPYPGFAPSAGAIGEYNGKFMSNQWVLRGGSCVSHAQQLRASYRNFFYPRDRWQFSGLRLAV